MSLVHNERTKLTATWLNTLGAGIIVTGVIAPLVAVVYGVQGPSEMAYSAFALLSLVWFSVGTALHLFARRLLRGLQE